MWVPKNTASQHIFATLWRLRKQYQEGITLNENTKMNRNKMTFLRKIVDDIIRKHCEYLLQRELSGVYKVDGNTRITYICTVFPYLDEVHNM